MEQDRRRKTELKAYCPEFDNPDGNTGCIAAAMVKKLEALDCAINGVPASPGIERQIGIKATLEEYIAERRQENARKWTRSDKIGVAAIVATVLLAVGFAVVPPTVVFFRNLYSMAQEFEKIHHSEIERQKTSSQYYNAHMGQKQQLATKEY